MKGVQLKDTQCGRLAPSPTQLLSWMNLRKARLRQAEALLRIAVRLTDQLMSWRSWTASHSNRTA